MAHAVAALLAFWLGYSVNYSGTCAVSAAHEVVHQRRARRLAGLIIASLSAGLVAIPLVWSGSVGAVLATPTSITAPLIAGAIMFGLGALANDACLLGSLGRLGNGESRLLALPVGLVVGFMSVAAWHDFPGMGGVSILARPTAPGAAILAGYLLALGLLVAQLRRALSPGKRSDSVPSSMVLLGLTGGALYALVPAWAYSDLLLASLPIDRGATQKVAVGTVLAAIAGAIASAHHRRTWRPQRASAREIGRTLFGGTLMGAGAALIPGGNDSLILAAVPALSPGGTVAYLTMLLVIVLTLTARSLATRPDPE